MRMRLALVGRLGVDAGDAIDEFLNLALDYERISHPSLQGFLGWMRKADTEVKRDMERGRDEVRVMTVHGAKGLESNIVILPDTCKPPTGRGGGAGLLPLPRTSASPGAPDHLIWVPAGNMTLAAVEDAKGVLKEAERREHNRLLYVAMTRARDRLYVCGWQRGKKLPEGCWYALVKAGMDNLAEDALDDLGNPVRRYESEGNGKVRAHDEAIDPVLEAIPASALGAPRCPAGTPAHIACCSV